MTNWKPSQLFVHTFKPIGRYTFKHLETNLRNLLEIELKNDLTLPFLSLVKIDLCGFFCFFFFVTSVGREIECVGTTESNSILYISVRVPCMIKLNIKESFKTWMLNFLDRSNCLLWNDHFFDKEKIYFEAGAINTDGKTGGKCFLKKYYWEETTINNGLKAHSQVWDSFW